MGYQEMFGLRNKVALVVGGTGGIGREIANAYADFGARVAVVGYSSLEKARTVAEDVGRRGTDALGLQANLQDAESVEAAVDAAYRWHGRIDVVVNTAGNNKWAPASEFPEEDWQFVQDANLKSKFLVSRAVGRRILDQGTGSIINISSVRSQLGMREGYTAYCAAMGAVNMYTKCLANEWARYKIRVNALAPTFIRTPLVAHLLENEQFYNTLRNRIPLGRVGEPSDMVGAAVFLASDAASFITGQVLFVDGGITASQ